MVPSCELGSVDLMLGFYGAGMGSAHMSSNRLFRFGVWAVAGELNRLLDFSFFSFRDRVTLFLGQDALRGQRPFQNVDRIAFAPLVDLLLRPIFATANPA